MYSSNLSLLFKCKVMSLNNLISKQFNSLKEIMLSFKDRDRDVLYVHRQGVCMSIFSDLSLFSF